MGERRTPLYDIHLRTASKMVKGGGDYLYPLSYTSPVEEHLNTRTNVGLQDLSTMGEVDVKGPGAERLLNRLLVNEIRDMHPGQMRYSTLCNPEGGIVDDITVYKFGDEHFMVVTSSGPRKKTTRWIAEHAVGQSTYITDQGGALGLISVQGPRSRDFLLNISQEIDLENLRFFNFDRGIVGETNVLISRSGYTGEHGYEVYIPAEQTQLVWESMLQNGLDYGVQPYGVSAMQSLRIEKAYPLYGPDINEDINPFQLGLHSWIRFDKREFVGRDALLEIQDRGLDQRWVGMYINSSLAGKSGDRIFSIADINSFQERMYSGSEAGDELDIETAGVQVGELTSSAKGHSVGEMLGLGFVDTTHAWTGNILLVEINQRPVLAKIVSTPFFDPGNVRLRSRAPRKVEP